MSVTPHDQLSVTPFRKDRRDPNAGESRRMLADALARCRAQLDGKLGDAERPFTSDSSLEKVHEAVRAFATIAGRNKVPPERVLAIFKETIFQLPEMRTRASDERDAITQQLVSMAIEAYYDVRQSGEHPAQDD